MSHLFRYKTDLVLTVSAKKGQASILLGGEEVYSEPTDSYADPVVQGELLASRVAAAFSQLLKESL